MHRDAALLVFLSSLVLHSPLQLVGIANAVKDETALDSGWPSFHRAREFHAAGQLDDALENYLASLAADGDLRLPADARFHALFGAGMVCAEKGDHSMSYELLTNASVLLETVEKPLAAEMLGMLESTLARTSSALNDRVAAQRHFEASLRYLPDSPEAHYDFAVWLESHPKSSSISNRMFQLLQHALSLLHRDHSQRPRVRHRGLRRPFHLWALVLHKLGNLHLDRGDKSAAVRTFNIGVDIGLWADANRRWLQPLLHPLWKSYPIITRRSHLYPHAAVEILESNFEKIRAELLSKDTDRSRVDAGENLARGYWKMLRFSQDGILNSTICDMFPVTCELLLDIPHSLSECLDAACAEIFVFVSVLQPGTVIKPHCGPTHKRLRIHLPIKVPSTPASPELIVAGSRLTWSEGLALVFDDSFEHQVAWMDGTGERVLLIVDVFHPEYLKWRGGGESYSSSSGAS